MTYTAYKESELEALPKKYRKIVCGLRECNNIMRPPMCPECDGYMMEQPIAGDMYLSCTECGCCRKMRVIS